MIRKWLKFIEGWEKDLIRWFKGIGVFVRCLVLVVNVLVVDFLVRGL